MGSVLAFHRALFCSASSAAKSHSLGSNEDWNASSEYRPSIAKQVGIRFEIHCFAKLMALYGFGAELQSNYQIVLHAILPSICCMPFTPYLGLGTVWQLWQLHSLARVDT